MQDHILTDLSDYRARYNYTAYLSNRDWAYEYLRRNPEFEKAAWDGYSHAPASRIACHGIKVVELNKRQPEAEKWGLRYFPNPDIAAPKAEIFWLESADPHIVQITVLPRQPGESHDLFEKTISKCKIIHLTDQDGVEHLVHVGPGSSLQVRCTGHTLVTDKHVKTFLSVSAVDDFDAHLKLVQRAKRVYGEHVADPPRFSRRTRLLRNGLIALDGYKAGLSDRQVAAIIEGQASIDDAISKGDRSLIQRVSAYRAKAKEFCGGRYRELLECSEL